MENGVNGKITWNNKFLCFSIELPWLQNRKKISCIPEGRYELEERYSEKFKQHWEVKNVPKRSGILLHTANNALKELQGCIAPVSELTGVGEGVKSRTALNKLHILFKQCMIKKEQIFLTITH